MSSNRASIFIVFARATHYALQNMWRNFGLTLITVSILVMCLLSVNVLLSVQSLTDAAVRAINKQVDMSVFFAPTAKLEQIDAVKKYIGQFPEVANMDYISADDALAAFRERHKDNTEITKSLEVLETNPLGAILIVRTKDTKDYKRILDALASQQSYSSFIQKRSFEDRGKILDRVEAVTSRAETFSLGLAALFALIAILIIFNTIRIAIYTQREEIGIKKLVGATNGFIRAPFFIEVFIYVAISVGLVALLMYSSARVIDPYLGPVFTDGGFSVRQMFFSNPFVPFGLEFLILLGITWLTSLIAMRKYLRT